MQERALRSADGLVFGALCILDSEPRTLEENEVTLLETMAADVVAAITESDAIGVMRGNPALGSPVRLSSDRRCPRNRGGPRTPVVKRLHPSATQACDRVDRARREAQWRFGHARQQTSARVRPPA